jgi:hypothetical protein
MYGLSLVLAIFASASALAGGLPVSEKWKCSKEMTGTINELGIVTREEWKKNFIDGSPSYKIPTTKVGEWLLVEKHLERDALVHMTPTQKNVYTYDQKNCQAKLEVSSLQPAKRAVASDDYFTDQTLAELSQKSPDGILYIWSPYMALSLKAVAELKVAADEVGLPITYAMDPFASEEDARNAVKMFDLPKSAMKRVDSMELSMRNALIHYPALMVLKEGKICKKVQRGYRTADKFRAIIADIYGGCK